MNLRGSRACAFAIALCLASAQGACSKGFGTIRGQGSRLQVDLKEKETGTRLTPLPLVIGTPQSFHIVVTALGADGATDTSFNGFVMVSSKPGGIERIDSPAADGRNVKLTNGVSPEVEVRVVNAYGPTYILADDIGYEPGDPTSDPPPACADGVDNDGDGKIDFPTDEGCAFANDKTETGGTYSQGATKAIFYALPRIADARGLQCVGDVCTGGGVTPYKKEPLAIDTGYHEKAGKPPEFDYDLVVTRISTDGFYVTDTKDTRGGFNSLFTFNFNAPPGMRVCDRLKTFAGTADEFFGLTQMGYPTWTLEEWDPAKRPCLVPEPRVLTPIDIPSTQNATANLLPLTGSLVRVLTASGKLEARVTPKFGPDNMQQFNGTFVPTENATNCDFNHDGKIDFTAGSPEQLCSDACTNDPECTEYSNFAQRSAFRITVTDSQGSAAIQADASTSAEFKPLERRGQVLRSFTGTLSFFSGGNQYTIEARCKDDIVIDKTEQPLPSDRACVLPRLGVDDPSN
jgi:hypothetical protein